MLVKGVRWQVGDDQSIHVFKDPWMLRPQSFKPITIPTDIHLHRRVADFICINGEWDWTKIYVILWDMEVEEVKRKPYVAIQRMIGWFGTIIQKESSRFDRDII